MSEKPKVLPGSTPRLIKLGDHDFIVAPICQASSIHRLTDVALRRLEPWTTKTAGLLRSHQAALWKLGGRGGLRIPERLWLKWSPPHLN